MTLILERAKRAPVPAIANEYETADMRLLIVLCRELQREAGENPFFLASTMAAELLGWKPMRAWRYLDGLVRDGVLALVSKGDWKARKASSYRYLGD